jgi:uncharacterized OsmC-like protein
MKGDKLREMQAPLKARYRETPEAALVTLRASGEIGEATLTCKVETGRALVEAGLHPATGGSGLDACSGDMLLEALVACAGVTLKAVATALELPLRRGVVSAEGDLLSRHARRRQGRPGRLPRDQVALRPRYRRFRRAGGDADETHRALLRRLADAARTPDHNGDAGIRGAEGARSGLSRVGPHCGVYSNQTL